MGEGPLVLIAGAIPAWAEEFSGDGYGNGDSYGYGDGYGSGYGSGYGYGYGNGAGYGYGNGDGDGYWRAVFVAAMCRWTQAQREIADVGTFLAFWKSDKDGSPMNGGHRFLATEGLKQEINGPLQLCGPHALHATLKPQKWKGDRLWIVALHGEVAIAEDKVGALKREIIGEVK